MAFNQTDQSMRESGSGQLQEHASEQGKIDNPGEEQNQAYGKEAKDGQSEKQGKQKQDSWDGQHVGLNKNEQNMQQMDLTDYEFQRRSTESQF